MRRFLPLLSASLLPALGVACAQSVPRTDTPRLVQLTLGPTLSDLPGFGSMYCVPTSTTMELLWLGMNGFGTLAPTSFDQNNPADVAKGYNLDLVIAGLMGTTPLGGTDDDGFKNGIDTYLKLQGFSGQYTIPDFKNPTVANLGQYLTGYNINVINIAWFNNTGSTVNGDAVYTRKSGHDVALLAVNGTTQATINNPEPASLLIVSTTDPASVNTVANVQETLNIADIPDNVFLSGSNGDSAGANAQLLSLNHTGTAGEKSLAVIAGVSVVQFSSTLTPENFTVQTFNVDKELTINTNGGSFSVAAPIVSDFRITKTGSGTMTLTNTVQGGGGFTVSGGVLESLTMNATATPVSPFGNGDIVLQAGGLAVSPGAAAGGDAQILLASGSSRTLTYGAGGNTLALNRGGNSTLTVLVGGHNGDGVENLTENEFGTLAVQSSDPISALGSTTKLLVVGSGSNLPATHNGIVSPSIVGQQNNADASGVFLTYSASNGFAQAATTSGTSLASATDTTIFQTTGDVTVTGTATVAALLANNMVSGDVLRISPNGADQAGIILNQGAVISTAQLDFGDRTAFLYSSQGGGTISSVLNTTDSVVTFGPGQTTLSGATSNIGGSVYVNSGTLLVQNHGIGSAGVTVRQDATLKIGGVVSGMVTASAGSVVLLAGGTMATAPVLSAGSTLGGTGLVQTSGSLTLQGNLGSTTQGGLITFDAVGTTTVATGSLATLNFTLTSLTSGTGGFDPGWTGFVFANDASVGTSADQVTIGLNFSNIANPDDPNEPAFWKSNHEWRFLEFDGTFAWSGSNYKFLDNNYYTGTFDLELVQGTGGDPSYVDLTYKAVPEPGTWALLALSLGAGMLRLRQNRSARA